MNCSFCDKGKLEVLKLVARAAPSAVVAICNECIGRCVDICNQEGVKVPALARPQPAIPVVAWVDAADGQQGRSQATLARAKKPKGNPMTKEQIYRQALEDIVNPIAKMQRDAEAMGHRLDGGACVFSSNDPGFLKGEARDALARAESADPPALTVTAMAQEAYQTACDKGWHDFDFDPVSSAVSNIAAAGLRIAAICDDIEAYRKGIDPELCQQSRHSTLLSHQQIRVLSWLALISTEATEAMDDVLAGHMNTVMSTKGKPEGFGSELADIIIRVCNIAGATGIDIEAELRKKLAYNQTRNHRHDGKLA